MKKFADIDMTAYHKERHACLGSSPTFIDEKMLIIGLFSFDVFALEQWLQRKHGIIPEGVSLRDFLMQHYGERAVRFVERYLAPMAGTKQPLQRAA